MPEALVCRTWWEDTLGLAAKRWAWNDVRLVLLGAAARQAPATGPTVIDFLAASGTRDSAANLGEKRRGFKPHLVVSKWPGLSSRGRGIPKRQSLSFFSQQVQIRTSQMQGSGHLFTGLRCRTLRLAFGEMSGILSIFSAMRA